MSELLTHTARHLDGTLKLKKYHGHRREVRIAKLADSDIVLTTYHTIAADVAFNKNTLHQIGWYRLVLDEGRNRSLHQAPSSMGLMLS
jgi:SWI/SNF-related matrix-associated actin-dependent regulator of chromatin subfamily A3